MPFQGRITWCEAAISTCAASGAGIVRPHTLAQVLDGGVAGLLGKLRNDVSRRGPRPRG